MRCRRALWASPPKVNQNTGESVTLTVSGAILTGSLGQQVAGLYPFIYANRLVAIAVTVTAAGAGVTIDRATINGFPARVNVQANTGGSLVAIISAFIPAHTDVNRRAVLWAELSAAGATNATSLWYIVTGLTKDTPSGMGSATTAIGTTPGTVTIPVYSGGLIMAAAINDVATANQCTWSGTGSVGEITDAASGAYRVSTARNQAPAEGQTQTVISTWDVISTTGVSLVAASWR